MRDHLGITPGDRVDFRRAADGSVVLVRTDNSNPTSRCARLHGHAGTGLSTDAIMALTRGVTLVDANVLLDLVTKDPVWAEWSQLQLEAASLREPLPINRGFSPAMLGAIGH